MLIFYLAVHIRSFLTLSQVKNDTQAGNRPRSQLRGVGQG
jgi:hypothetical protein